MFSAARRTLTFLLAVYLGLFVLFRYYGTVFILAGSAAKAATRVEQDSAASDYTWKTAKSGEKTVPALPDISRFTVDHIAAMVPPPMPGKIGFGNLREMPDTMEFVKKDGRLQRFRLMQGVIVPRAIVISDGHYNFSRLRNELRALAPDALQSAGDNIYLLRLPILVGRHASLTLSGNDLKELRLSQDKGAFIANSGGLYILRVKVTGWNEKLNHPSLFKDKTIFRPFITAWSGSHTYIAGSTLASLGYRRGKSYGLSYSTCPFCLQSDPSLPRPAGAVVGSVFTDMYYGFYSYEANDIAIVGNTYANNAIYGIDPHDRSERLIIAGNEIYGSGKKHGIILSRNVNDSWIFDNNCHHNHGSGIMLDRTSENNVIANNVSSRNEGDGITFFESQNNITYNNRVYDNGNSGIRIRNSWNIRMAEDQITDNGRVPIVIYTARLEDRKDKRDFKEDPYTRRAGASLSETILKLSDRKPAFKLDGASNLTLSDIHLLSGGPLFADGVLDGQEKVSPHIENPTRQIMLADKLPAP